MSLHHEFESGSEVPEAEQFPFGAVPVFFGRAVLPAASLPVGIGQAGNLFMGRRGNGNGWTLVELAAYAARISSCAGMGHEFRTPIVITEVGGITVFPRGSVML